MTDNNEKPHKPVLREKEQGVEKSHAHGPVLLSDDNRGKKIAPPYFFFALIIFALAGMFWKMVVRETEPVGLNYEQRLKDAQSAQEQGLQEFQEGIRGRR